MRKTDRYTVPFPPAEPPSPEIYRDRFRAFPFWYRWYLRIMAIVKGMPLDRIVQNHDLQELRRRLAVVARDVVDGAGPALLPEFHRRLRALDVQCRRIAPALQDTLGTARGEFLRSALARMEPQIHEALEIAAEIPETLLESTETTLAVAQEAVRTHIATELESHRALIEKHINPIWISLNTLNVLTKTDFSPFLPPGHELTATRTPLRVVRTPMQELHQVLELVRSHTNRQATELAWDFVRHHTRRNPGVPGAIWSVVEEFTNTIPMLDLTRLAWEEPFLEIPELSIRSEWWETFRHTWISSGVHRAGPRFLEHRTEQVREMLSRGFLIDREPITWIPSELYPSTLGYVLLLAQSEFFHDTRRVITQLVIDGVFHLLDTRNALHQAALQIDQAMERLVTLFGSGDNRGTLGEELHRVQRRAGTSALARRRVVGVYERHRHRIRTALEEFIEAVETGGTLVERTLSGREVAFDYQQLRTQSFSGEYTAEDLLRIVGDHWYPLGRRLRALYRIESTGI
jgi:hypothetical protein